MNHALAQRLFLDQAHSTLADTRELLAGDEGKGLWEMFFRHVHDLKAAAMAAGLEQDAQRLHGLEGGMWGDRSTARLQQAQIEMENWFPATVDQAAPLREALEMLAGRLRQQAEQLGKRVDVYVAADTIAADTALPAGAWSALLHLAHNALVHGSKDQGSVWLGAYEAEDRLCVRVDDEGKGAAPPSQLTMLSGRGQGLAAVEACARKWGGEFQRRPSPHGGTQAMLWLPVSARRAVRAS